MRSLSIASFRVPVYAIWPSRHPLAAQWLSSARRNQNHVRAFSLFKLAHAKTTLGAHGIKAYTPFHPPELRDDRLVNIYVKNTGTTGADGDEKAVKKRRGHTPMDRLRLVSTVPASKLLTDIPRGSYLLPIPSEIPSAFGSEFVFNTPPDAALTALEYELREIPPVVPIKEPSKKARNHFKGLAEIYFSFTQAPSRYKELLKNIATKLASHRPVEIHVRVPIKGGFSQEKEKISFDWHWATHPHLWPEVILNAMPEGTYVQIRPYFGNNELAWVVGRHSKPLKVGVSDHLQDAESRALPHHLDFTPRVEKMRKAQIELEERGIGMPILAKRKKFREELKKREADGEPVPPSELPLWYKTRVNTAKKFKALKMVDRIERENKKKRNFEPRLLRKLGKLEVDGQGSWTMQGGDAKRRRD
ncbi:uncharacterized protein BDZ99DRAFT_527275 [Mytilinidion resinicola]|uniref:Uncharacterized protein n=1 Tax=Mytilinidion resinicola TaxID=574789 RepID=A0A6A6Y1N3_9PEZI|nr:uncharacterized protein BDZ99DRAFT_527275 [Mytilinidion resinicola]KAF2802549.1 hypothetical protein BDZ99DRAFT_527275 [Mytilinidion resinicola]